MRTILAVFTLAYPTKCTFPSLLKHGISNKGFVRKESSSLAPDVLLLFLVVIVIITTIFTIPIIHLEFSTTLDPHPYSNSVCMVGRK